MNQQEMRLHYPNHYFEYKSNLPAVYFVKEPHILATSCLMVFEYHSGFFTSLEAEEQLLFMIKETKSW